MKNSQHCWENCHGQPFATYEQVPNSTRAGILSEYCHTRTLECTRTRTQWMALYLNGLSPHHSVLISITCHSPVANQVFKATIYSIFAFAGTTPWAWLTTGLDQTLNSFYSNWGAIFVLSAKSLTYRSAEDFSIDLLFFQSRITGVSGFWIKDRRF